MLALYKLLPLEKLGHFEWALALVMLLSLVGDLGLGAALVQLPDADEDHFDTAFWTCLSWGLLLTAAVIAAVSWLAPLLGGEDPHTFGRVLRTLCLAIPCAHWRAYCGPDFSATSTSAPWPFPSSFQSWTFAFTVTLLLSGDPNGRLDPSPRLGRARTRSLQQPRPFGPLASAACASGVQALRQILGFALNLTGSRVVALLNTKIAYFFIFVPLGATAQAYYSLAERLTLQPLTRLATTIQRVSFPNLFDVRGRRLAPAPWLFVLGTGFRASTGSSSRRGYSSSRRRLPPCSTTEPMWMVLRLLAAATLLKVASTLVGSIFMAKGKTNWSFYWSLFSMGVLIPALYFYGLPRGVEGVASVIAATALLFLLLSQYLVNRLIGLPFATYLAALSRPGLVVAFVFTVLLLARPLLPWSPLAVLAVGATLASRRHLSRPFSFSPATFAAPIGRACAGPDFALGENCVWGCFGICF